MTRKAESGFIRAAATLSVVLVFGWILCFWPARILRGEAGVQWMTLAAICCLVPGWIVVFLSGLAIVRNELAALLLQTSVRLFSVAGAALFVRKMRPEFGFADFSGWLVLFYLLSMATEVWLLKRSLRRR
ncbi:MAG: hypothetical protein KDA91_15220 [Planctomycetaceae bacterium]|nr:hypothetical protein [Planctomycetaceae bacterium]